MPVELGRQRPPSPAARPARSIHGTAAACRRRLIGHDGDGTRGDGFGREVGTGGLQPLQRDEHIARLRHAAGESVRRRRRATSIPGNRRQASWFTAATRRRPARVRAGVHRSCPAQSVFRAPASDSAPTPLPFKPRGQSDVRQHTQRFARAQPAKIRKVARSPSCADGDDRRVALAPSGLNLRLAGGRATSTGGGAFSVGGNAEMAKRGLGDSLKDRTGDGPP